MVQSCSLVILFKFLPCISLIIFTTCNVFEGAMAQQQDANQTAPTVSKRLKIVVPVKPGFVEFANTKPDAVTGEPTFGGFSVDIFKAVINTAMPYTVSFDFFPFKLIGANGTLSRNYDDMLKAVSSGEYDAAVGDISITYYRTQWVEFTLPHSETGVSMLVRSQQKTPDSKNSFLNRLPKGLIGAAVAACILNALLFALLRMRYPRQGTNIATSMGLENIICFMVLVVIVTCFTAMLLWLFIARTHETSSINIDQRIDHFLTKNVGYQQTSFVYNLLTQRGFSDSQLKPYTTINQLHDLLSKGSDEGGVDAVFGEVPYLKLFLTQHCTGYTLVPLATFHGDGFGFAFRRKMFSTLVDDISVATLKVTNDAQQLRDIKERTIGDLETCREDITAESMDVEWKPAMWILIAGGLGVVVLMVLFYLAYFGII